MEVVTMLEVYDEGVTVVALPSGSVVVTIPPAEDPVISLEVMDVELDEGVTKRVEVLVPPTEGEGDDEGVTLELGGGIVVIVVDD